MIRQLCAALVVLSALSSAWASDTSARDFARRPEYDQLKISPKGDYLAVSVPLGEGSGIAVLRVSDMKALSATKLGAKLSAETITWVSPDRMVVALAESDSWIAQPHLTGELVALDADGKRVEYLVGYRGRAGYGAASTIRWGTSRVIDPLLQDPKHALITLDNWLENNDIVTTVNLIDVYTGQQRDVTNSPITGQSRFVTDAEGRPRYVVGTTPDNRIETFYRPATDDTWRPLGAHSLHAHEIVPISVAADGKSAYLVSDEDDGRSCLIQHEFEANQRKTVICNLEEVILASDRRSPIAVVSQPGRPVLRLLDTNHPDRGALLAMAKSLTGEYVVPVSSTEDGRLTVYLAQSDRSPGEYYLYDRDAGKARYLLSRRTWIDPEHMAEREPIEFKARDGTVLHGYLTVPPDRELKSLPLVVNPHGGPFFVRDEWFWDADAQFLASRGFAVLQVNFRGSNGYGRLFSEGGKRGWGTVMIDDIVDATRWVIDQRHADPQRVCIYGASYGGYAALMSAVREPGTFRCVVAYAGVYDLTDMQWFSDVGHTIKGSNYVDEYIGSSRAELLAQSPLTYIDKLKAPLFIAHGESDFRSPFRGAVKVKEWLEARHLPVESMFKRGEGHGFWNEDNRAEFNERMADFIQRNTGVGAAAPADAARPN